ncbi:NAD(P)-binding protein [Venturia nashicola]|nr:NAD(P)-binding protein [Venturia nashicola]
MPNRLQNKIAIVTGSSSGLGRAIALLYAKEGASVLCADLRPEARMNLGDEGEVHTHDLIVAEGGKAVFVKCDVGKAGDWEGVVRKCVELWGRIDILVNNAGIALEATNPAPIHLTSEETWDRTMLVNAKSVFLGCKTIITQMLKQELHECGGRGWIVNISSIYGIVGGGINPSYCASKGAVANLTRNIAIDYSKQLIHCNAICPGHVETAIFAETTQNMMTPAEMDKMYPFKGPGRPVDVARMAVVLACEDSSWMTGACVAVDGGFTAR